MAVRSHGTDEKKQRRGKGKTDVKTDVSVSHLWLRGDGGVTENQSCEREEEEEA